MNIEKAHIAGHSLGSVIAQELNISYRDKILIGSGVNVSSDLYLTQLNSIFESHKAEHYVFEGNRKVESYGI